ncbi:isoprenylcysteine carboxylmethyltransferase family protein [Telmatobacter sp. DSM 110680]|uniref:Isoprenylcysteine carboxylmethyltransferase family protein n=1 Tax=Telmatobacter sp. DSM 110680 TaxID=3036704 RepID=A0AAU7DIR3_9BACT
MRSFYAFLLPALWTAFVVYWRLMSANVKGTRRFEAAPSRITRLILFLVAIALLFLPESTFPWLTWLYESPLVPSEWTFFGGVVLTVAGLLFSIWARHQLGRNWSLTVTLKDDHELIVTGPYALVRHPIYTGLLVGFLGTAIAIMQVRSILALILILIALWTKIRMEERLMRDHFGAQYDVYSQRVSALIPYVF